MPRGTRRGRLRTRGLLNRKYYLNQGLVSWYLALPHLSGGQTWYDLCGQNNGTLTSMGGQTVTTPDASGNGNTGTLTNGPYAVADTPSALGSMSTRSLILASASSQYVSLPSKTWSSPVTVAAWVKAANIASDQQIINNDLNPRVWQFKLVASTGKARLLVFDSGGTFGSVDSTATVADGTWHHVCATWDGTTVKIYVDGQPSGSALFSGSFTASASGPIIGGGGGNTGLSYLNGTLDDVLVINGTALTPTQIANLANGTIDPATLSYVGGGGLWRFENFNVTTTNGWRPTTRPGGWGSVLFDGTAGKVTTPLASIDGSANFSVTAWVKEGTAQNGGIVNYGATWDAHNTWSLYASTTGTKVAFLVVDNAGLELLPLSGTNTLNDGNWHFLAGVLSGKTATLYLDGLSVGSVTNNSFSLTPTASTVTVGAMTGVGFFKGAVDDVRIYNRALSAAEIAALYRSSSQGYPGVLNRWDVSPAVLYPSGFGLDEDAWRSYGSACGWAMSTPWYDDEILCTFRAPVRAKRGNQYRPGAVAGR